MKRLIPALALAAMTAGALPAFANIGPIELPRLDFPEPTFPAPSQGCTQPGSLAPSVCEMDAG